MLTWHLKGLERSIDFIIAKNVIKIDDFTVIADGKTIRLF